MAATTTPLSPDATGARRRPKARLAILVIAALAAAVLSVAGVAVAQAATTAPRASTTAATTAALPWGLYQAGNNLQYSLGSAVPTYGIEYYSWSASGTEPFDTASASAAYARHIEPFAQLQPCATVCTTSSGYSLADITSGKYDASLTAYNTAVKTFGHPILMTFAHEMNGNWTPWGYQAVTPAQWIAAWNHVTSVINAPNITWVWAPNYNTTSHYPLSAYWPGASHVGICGIDGYLSTSASTWANTLAASVASLKSTCGTKPWTLAETGVNDTDPNAVQQIDDLVTSARANCASSIFYFSKYNWVMTPAMQTQFLTDIG